LNGIIGGNFNNGEEVLSSSDIDSDGDADFILMNYGQGKVVWLRNDEGLSLGIIEYLRQINNLPQFKPINFPYIGYQKEQDLYEQIRRRL
jgi:hypothetical protein